MVLAGNESVYFSTSLDEWTLGGGDWVVTPFVQRIVLLKLREFSVKVPKPPRGARGPNGRAVIKRAAAASLKGANRAEPKDLGTNPMKQTAKKQLGKVPPKRGPKGVVNPNPPKGKSLKLPKPPKKTKGQGSR